MRSLLAIAALCALGAAAKDERVIEGSAPVGKATRITLDAGEGSLTLKAGGGETIRWRVELEPDAHHGWFSRRHDRDAREAIEGAKVEGSLRGESFELLLDLPRGADEDDISQHWTIEVPASFAARVALDVGELRVSGLGGGVRASVDVGSIDLDLPRGAVEASADVGDIEIVLGEAPEGDIDLEADVGDVDLTLDGRHIRNDRGDYGPGESVRLTGKGGDRVRARVDVGDIDASIGKR